MVKVCYAEQMRQLDRRAIEDAGIPGIVLMENAAIACVSELQKELGDFANKRVGIFCGKGNNGGDGFAVARHLINRGAEVKVFLVCGEEFKGDALTNYKILEKMCANIEVCTENVKYYIDSCDAVVDAIYGTGVRGVISGIPRYAIESINRYSKYTLAVDIPSGVNADTGEICGIAVKADITVTFAAYKTGMFLFDGADCMGKTVCADISIPEYIYSGMEINKSVTDDEFVRNSLTERRNNSHKGDYGKVFIVGGSRGMTGAAAMAAQAALNMGSGLITLGIPESLNPILENKLTEVMTLPLPERDGILSYEAVDIIIDKMNKSDVILFGCGIGRSPDIKKILKRVLAEAKVPVVLDADGLYAMELEMLDDCSTNLILTPHSMEFARITRQIPTEQARFRRSEEFSTKYGVTLVLKGHYTVVTGCDGTQYINTTGNSGMAVGGSGDVLAGMITSLVGQGADEVAAAAAAVYLHGKAADILCDEKGAEGVLPTGIIDNIYRAVQDVRKGNV